jgi:hypothetical protein
MTEAITHVFADRDDELGMYRRWVTLHPDRRLTIEGHDIGPGVERAFGASEYEFVRTVDPHDVRALRAALDVSGSESLIEVISDRFRASQELEQFLEQHEIASSFWNRIGD